MVLLATVALVALASPPEATTRTVDAVYEREFCEEPLHKQSRFCGDRGISSDDPRREAYRSSCASAAGSMGRLTTARTSSTSPPVVRFSC